MSSDIIEDIWNGFFIYYYFSKVIMHIFSYEPRLK